MKLTLTAKIRIQPDPRQQELLFKTLKAVKAGSNFVSDQVFQSNILARTKLIKMTYPTLRTEYRLRSQMSQSIAIAVLAKYKSAKSNGHDWSRIRFKKPEYDLVFNRDYSLRPNGLFSINTLEGRIQVTFVTKGMEHYFDGTWKFGTAKLVFKNQNYFLHIPMTKTIRDIDLNETHNVVGVDLGINFLAVTYNSGQTTSFFKGRLIKDQRAHYKRIRTSLQQKQTPSARRRLKQIGSRENRWMTDVNHQVSKALVEQAGTNSLIVLEELKGVRTVTERVRKCDRWVTVSWAFHQLRQMIEYKGKMNQVAVIAVDPAFSSQACPKCEHTAKANRRKKSHLFTCQRCGYTSNDDRIGAMNLQRKGIEYLSAVTASA